MENKVYYHKILINSDYAVNTCEFGLRDLFRWNAVYVINSTEFYVGLVSLRSTPSRCTPSVKIYENSWCVTEGRIKIPKLFNNLKEKNRSWVREQINNNLSRITTEILQKEYPELADLIMLCPLYPPTVKIDPIHGHNCVDSVGLYFRFLCRIEDTLMMAMVDPYYRWVIYGR